MGYLLETNEVDWTGNGLIRVRATTVCPSAHGFTAECPRMYSSESGKELVTAALGPSSAPPCRLGNGLWGSVGGAGDLYFNFTRRPSSIVPV